MDLDNNGTTADSGDTTTVTAGSAADFLGGDAGKTTADGSTSDVDAGTSPAGTTDGDAAADANADGAEPDWYANLSADADGDKASLRDWVKATGAKDLNGLAKIARDNQAALRESGRVKVPGEGASAEERAEFAKAIGVPEDASGYELPAPKGDDGEPLPLNDGMLQRLAENAHKAGIPKGAFEALLKEEVQSQLDERTAMEGELTRKATEHVKSWGAERDAKIAAVDTALNALGVNRDESMALRAALGPARALDMFAKLGAGLSEDNLMTGAAERKFGVSGEQAQAEMDRLKADPDFQKKVAIPGSAERQRWNRLQEAAGAAADRKAARGE